MSSMLKKKSGFKPKAPIRRTATGPAAPLPSEPTATAEQFTHTPTLPAASTAARRASTNQSPLPDAALSSSATEGASQLSPPATNALSSTGGTERRDPQSRASTVASGKLRSTVDRAEGPSDGSSSTAQGASASQDSGPAAVNPAPAQAGGLGSDATRSGQGPPMPLTPVSTIPSIETPDKTDPRVTTRQAAAAAARLGGYSPSLTPGADRLPTPINQLSRGLVSASATQLSSAQTQPTQGATPPAEPTVAEPQNTIQASAAPEAAPEAAATAQKRGARRKASEGTAAQPRKRTKKTTTTVPGESQSQDGAATTGTAQRRRRQTERAEGEEGERTPRNRRAETPEDAENEKLDITKVKMADLTKDLRIGKKFSLHDQLVQQERERRLRYVEERKRRLASQTSMAEGAALEDGNRLSVKAPGASDTGLSPTDDLTGDSTATAAGPQFQIVDGQIVLDASSLQVDRHARAVEEAGNMEVVEENEFTRRINSSTYLRRKRKPQQWTDEETDEFYRLLRMFGTDFETISRMMPGKDRSNIIGKFRREDKMNPKLITAALTGPKTSAIDINEYQRLAGERLETTADIMAAHQQAEDEFEAEQKRREEEAEEEARKKREALYGTRNADGESKEDGDSVDTKVNKRSKGGKLGKMGKMGRMGKTRA